MSHPERAAVFASDPARVRWHDQALWFVRKRRDVAAAQVPEWEALRDAAAAIKRHSVARLAFYLEQFEENALSL